MGSASPARLTTSLPPAKVPAAGAGTRITPRPIPRSSSSLRHIQSKASRTSSFGTPLPEDRDPSSSEYYETELGASLAQRSVDAYNRRHALQLEQEDLFAEEDDDYSGDAFSDDSDSDLNGESPSPTHQRNSSDALGLLASEEAISSRRKGKDRAKDDELAKVDESGSLMPRRSSWRHSRVPDSTSSEDEGQEKVHASADPKMKSRNRDEGASYLDARPRLAIPDDDDDDIRGLRRSSGGLDLDSPLPNALRKTAQTPGPYFPRNLQAVQTPQVEGSMAATPELDPRQRLEWQTMLRSVLGSEVLRSETKRITSVDAPDLSRSEIIYQRWLEMRAFLRGRGHVKGAAEAEGKMLMKGWPVMMKEVIQAVKDCRSKSTIAVAEETVAGDLAEDGPHEEAHEGTQDTEAKSARSQEEKDRIFEEVGSLLRRVHEAEEQFPSQRKMMEIVPAWAEREVQDKLAALYSWHNVLSALRLQIKLLQQWTGSARLEIAAHPSQHSDVPPPPEPTEENTFVERLMKENDLKSTFEKRTLKALNSLLLKAKEAIRQHHVAFAEMELPSFEPELVQLIGFPASLMEGALALRLDYAGKLKDPSILIVDSLTDDIRSALALACRVKLQYNAIMVPDPDNGWELPPSLDDGYDAVLRDALRFFFRLLNFKLKGSVFFKETEILEPEWLFLSTAVSVINGGDIIVAKSVTRIVNRVSCAFRSL